MFSYYRQVRVKVNQMYFSENTMFSNFLFVFFISECFGFNKKAKRKNVKKKNKDGY